MKIFAAFSLVLLLISPTPVQALQEDDKSTSSTMKQFEGIPLQDFKGKTITLKELLSVDDFSKPGVLIFIAEANDKVLDFARLFNVIVEDNKSKKGTRGAVIIQSKDEDAIATAKKILTGAELSLSLGVAVQSPDAKATEVHKMSKDKPVFVVIWNDSKIIVDKLLSAKELKDDDPVLSDILVEFLSLLD